jgi:hypothetical protein
VDNIQWNIALSLFFVPYILLGTYFSCDSLRLGAPLSVRGADGKLLWVEIPSNVLLKKFSRPSVYIGGLVTTWGVIMTLHGIVQNFGGLLAVRLLLGVFEYVLQ